MMLVWQLLDAKNQKLFDIKNPKSREFFLSWFFVIGVRRYKIECLVSHRWRIWLQMNVQKNESGKSLKQSKLLEMQISPQKSLSDGQTQLALWHWLKPFNKGAEIKKPKKQLIKKLGVNLYGFAYGELGIGEDLRMAVACCESAEIPYRIVNIEASANVGNGDRTLEKTILEQNEEIDFPINVFIIPGFDTAERIFMVLGSEIFHGHYNIGWWPWELGVWPKKWLKIFDLVDELWAGSQFTYEMYLKYSKKKCSLVPLAVSVEQKSKGLTRENFGLPTREFLFLYIFDFNSSLNRKNPYTAIEAFIQFVKNDNKCVGLILKTMNSKIDDPSWNDFELLCKSHDGIHLINKTMPKSEVLALIDLCDVYISTHRAEGFGRTIAEALLLGKQTIATNYSGNKMFADNELMVPLDFKIASVGKNEYHFISPEDGAEWADVCIDSTIKAMEKAFLNANNNKILQYITDIFNPARIGAIMREKINEVSYKFQN